MKRIILKEIALILVWICDLTHKLPYSYEERLQEKIFIRFIGYHCPFATWSYRIDRMTKFTLGIWKLPNENIIYR